MGCPVSRVCGFLNIVFMLTLLSSGPFYTVAFALDHETISIGNNSIEISFKCQASLEVTSIKNGITGVEYIFSGSPIFLLVLFNRTINKEITISASDAINYNYHFLEARRILIVKYLGFRKDKFFNINVTLTIIVSDKSEIIFSIIVDKEENIDIYYIMYPIIDGIAKLGSKRENTFLIIPSWLGSLIVGNPSRFCCPGYPANPYPTGEQNIQFMALFDTEGAGSLYIYTNDTRGFYKSFRWNGKGDTGLMSVVHYPEIGKFRTYSPPYSVILGVSDARDWKSSVKPYKEWASKQWWSQSRKNNSWLSNTHFVVYSTAYIRTPPTSNVPWRHVEFEDIIEAARELRKRIYLYDGITLFFLSGWEKHGHCVSYPDVFPPKEGWDGLRRLVDELHKMGFKVGIFLLGSFLMLDEGQISTEGYKYIVKDIYGNPYQLSPDFVFLDPASEYWKTALINISVSLVKYADVDLLYYDTVPCTPVNYADSQEHPIGGGNYTINAWIEIFKEIRRKTVDIKPELAIVTEGLTEPLIPFVDGTFLGGSIFFNPLGISDRAEVVDLFSEIYYGGNVIKLGWWISPRELLSLVFYEGKFFKTRQPNDETYTYSLLSRAFLYGFPIPFGAFHYGGLDKESIEFLLYDEKLFFMEKLAYARTHYLQTFLIEGELLEKGEEGPEIVLIHPRGEGMFESNPFDIILKPIQYSVWSTAQGNVARIYVNVWNRPLTLYINRSEADIVLVDGFPIILPENSTINVMPKSLVAVIFLRNQDISRYLNIVRDSTLAHMLKLIRDLIELYNVRGNISLLQAIVDELIASQNFTLEHLVSQCERFKRYYESVFKEGYNTLVPLEVVIEHLTEKKVSDFGAVNFDDAVILPSLTPPTFISGNGVAYLSFRPMLIGYPHWDRTDELLGYHVVLFPSYSFDPSFEERNVVKVPLKLAVPHGQKNITVKISAGNFWHSEVKINVTIRDMMTNKTVLSVSQRGGGWRSYIIPIENFLILKLLEVTVYSEIGSVTGAGRYAKGSIATVTVSPIIVEKNFFLNYVFEGWKVNEKIVSTSPTYSFTVEESITLVASWRTELNLMNVSLVAIVVIAAIVSAIITVRRKHR